MKYEVSLFFIENSCSILFLNIFLLVLHSLVPFLKGKENIKNNLILKVVKVNLRWNVISRTFLENAIPLSLTIFLQPTALSFEGTYFTVCAIITVFAGVNSLVFILFLFGILANRDIKLLDKKLIRRIYVLQVA